MKKILAFVLVVVLMFATSKTVFAESDTDTVVSAETTINTEELAFMFFFFVTPVIGGTLIGIAMLKRDKSD